MKKCLLMAVAIVLFTKCKNDPTPPPVEPPNPNAKYFDVENGSFWVYANDSIAINGSIHSFGKDDTLRQIKDTTYLGQASKLMEHYFFNALQGTTSRINYCMFQNGNKVYVSKGFLGLFIPSFFVTYVDILPDSIKFADGSANTWNLNEIDVPNLDLTNFPDLPSVVSEISSGKIKIEFARGKDAVKSGFNTNLFTMKVVFAGNATIVIYGAEYPVPFEAVFSEINFYFNPEGKGLIEVEAKPMEVKIKATLSVPPFPSTPIEYPLTNTAGFKKSLKSLIMK
jgi:hypothetical protein